MKGQLLLLCAPSGGGKTTMSEFISKTFPGFHMVQCLATRDLRWKEEKNKYRIKTTLKEINILDEQGLLISRTDEDDPKDGVWYAIRKDAILPFLEQGNNMILEWDLNRITYFDKLCTTYKVILEAESQEIALEALSDGRDPDGRRIAGVIEEYATIIANRITKILPCDDQFVNRRGNLLYGATRIVYGMLSKNYK